MAWNVIEEHLLLCQKCGRRGKEVIEVDEHNRLDRWFENFGRHYTGMSYGPRCPECGEAGTVVRVGT